jgi:hypothetical protein
MAAPWTETEIRQIGEFVASGATWDEIGEILGRSPDAVRVKHRRDNSAYNVSPNKSRGTSPASRLTIGKVYKAKSKYRGSSIIDGGIFRYDGPCPGRRCQHHMLVNIPGQWPTTLTDVQSMGYKFKEVEA